MASAPAAANARATSTESSTAIPPSTQSVAEIRTVIGLSCGHTSRIAVNTSRGKRSRFSSDPPYASVRWLVNGEMKLDNR